MLVQSDGRETTVGPERVRGVVGGQNTYLIMRKYDKTEVATEGS